MTPTQTLVATVLLFLLPLLYPPPATLALTKPKPPRAVSPTAACKTSLYPKICRKILSTVPSATNLTDYGRFSVKHALKRARATSATLARYLSRSSTIRRADARALDDCRFLSDLNADFLYEISAELGHPFAAAATASQVERIRSYLSAIVTNHQTCFDGLTVSPGGVSGEISGELSSEAVLYSVSLGVVTNALSTEFLRGKKGFFGRNLLAGDLSAQVRANVPVRDWVTVAKDGSGNFSTVADAVAAAPNGTKDGQGYFVIHVKEGVYQEYVTVGKSKKYLMMVGDGIGKTIITGNRSFGDGWTTFGSATFAVAGERFVAMRITFRNTAGPAKHQAVALRNGADLSAFYQCRFEGYQDTLYAHSLRQFYRDCDIYGTVDFIFGNAAASFQNCNLYPRKAMENQKNAITAQGRTDPNQNTGISIQNCTIIPSPEFKGNLSSFTDTYLGRPWKNYSRTVYMESYIDGFINPAGWLEWSGDFGLGTLYYGEYENSGPGSNTSSRVKWPGFRVMSASDALNFTVMNFIKGENWLPSRLVPFVSGLA